jgi:hypothetical protein
MLWATNAHAEDWEGNFRRCEVSKSFPQGKVIITAGETIELGIRWDDEFRDRLNSKHVFITLQIDNIKLGTSTGVDDKNPNAYVGPPAALPALFQVRRIQISFRGEPETLNIEPINLEIGDGRKAVEFLKLCDKFWTCVAERDSPLNWPGKKKHCYYPRKIPL